MTSFDSGECGGFDNNTGSIGIGNMRLDRVKCIQPLWDIRNCLHAASKDE